MKSSQSGTALLAISTLLAVAVVAWPASSHADVIPTSVANCHGSSVGDDCRLARGGTGTCQETTCSRTRPWKTVQYDCLKCMHVQPEYEDGWERQKLDAGSIGEEDVARDDAEAIEDAGSSEEAVEDESTRDEESGDGESGDGKSSAKPATQEDNFATNVLVTAGSIGVGLLFVVVGYWRQTRDKR